MKENLGKRASDKITGWSGVVTSIHVYLNGPTQYGVTEKVASGELKVEYIYEESLQVID